MKEHLIPFTIESVKAIREDRKTQTRRVIRPQPPKRPVVSYAPYHVGDLLGVKESIYLPPKDVPREEAEYWVPHFYRADLDEERINALKELGWKLRTARFCGRDYVRYWLEVTGVRAERLQDIALEDILAEGIDPLEYCPICNGTGIPHTDFVAIPICKCLASLFTGLWDSIHRKDYPWSSNPYVWVYEFGRI
jgi:hypothetical protein